ncbi:alpha-amylase family protein [Litoribacter alkaliphilus]|uniref:Alpha-amylase family protein n=1 Tax=Litoribacter ruber TaxID=702568 RepID=A0AAP2CJB8_9BACT|nr:alpha-amylase family protein [Litoribacter alkaliphilus]MBS9525808.1 alpha-amylase family protein [Litoribacter alkaliphilus]
MNRKIYFIFLVHLLIFQTFVFAQDEKVDDNFQNEEQNEYWYKNSIIYNLDVDSFYDSDGDGVGDFAGLKEKLPYLKSLGVDVIWLAPFQKSPNKDNGYDIEDFYMIHPEYGTGGDLVEFMNSAKEMGIRVITDLVMNHTSDQHVWFQEAIKDKNSVYRDYYVWSEEQPDDYDQGMVFPGVQEQTWTYHPEAGEYYYHRFYEFQPDLNNLNPVVQNEMRKVMGYWLWMGFSGFRLDAVPFIIEDPYTGVEDPELHYDLIKEIRKFIQWRRGDALLLGEANVMPEENKNYFGDEGEGMHMLFNFFVNQHLFYSLATEEVSTLVSSLEETKDIPRNSQWAQFLRNHDELDLGRLSDEQQAKVYEKFGPDETMQVYDRGIRRRLAPMMNDENQIKMAYSLMFSLPGTPVIRYGDEIGMGEDLSLPEREAVRTPMQWTADKNAGFSTAEELENPVISSGEFSYHDVNVLTQQQDPNSLLNWTTRLINLRKSCPEIGRGDWEVIPTGSNQVLAIKYSLKGQSIIIVHNLSNTEQKVDLKQDYKGYKISNGLNGGGEDSGPFELRDFSIQGYGYAWYRLTSL